jgi:hypothetical protein
MLRRNYAIWWTEGTSGRHAGKVEVAPPHLLLSGNGAGRLAIPLEELDSIDYENGELMIFRRCAPPIRIGSLDAPGALLELTDALRQAA